MQIDRDSPCIDIQPITIIPLEKRILRFDTHTVDTWLSKDSIRRLAIRDGFGDRNADHYDAVDKFFNFFLRTYKEPYLEGFEIIWWDVNRLTVMEVHDGS